MQTRKLSARTVETISQPGRHSDGQGLYLAVDKSGARRWVFLWRKGGRLREMGLGSPARGVSLKLAREFATAAREAVARGLDPIKERDRSKAAQGNLTTFDAFAEEFITTNAGGWKNAKHAQMWRASITNHCKAIVAKPITDITTDDITAILLPLWAEKPETGRRIQNRVERIFDAAKAKGIRTGENPARWKGHLSALLPRRKSSSGHFAALPYAQAPAFVQALRSRPAAAAQALELLVLCANRPSEVLGAKWEEIDLANAVWTIPATRMKAHRVHRIPLSTRAQEIIEGLPSRGVSQLLFPGRGGRQPLSNMAFAQLLRRMGHADVTAHGFRSTFRDWAGDETGFARELAEAALAHVVGDRAEQSYRRSDALERRRMLMSQWADFLANKK